MKIMKKFILIILSIACCFMCKAQGAAQAFRGNNDGYASAGIIDYNFQDQFTVMGWAKWNSDPSQGESWANIVTINKTSRSDQGQFWIQHDRNNNKIEFAMELESGRSYLWSNPDVQEGKWIHFAGVYDGEVMRLYINGVEHAHRKRSGNIRPFEDDFELTLGCWAAQNHNRNFDGDMDEISIWNRALSAEEVRTNMCKKINLSEEGLLTYFQMDTVNEGELIDVVGGHNASIVNAETTTSTAPVGDESVYVYGNQDLELMATDHSIELSDFSGNPEGIHIYKINEAPNSINAYSEDVVEVIDQTYWGLFIVRQNGVTFKYSKRLNANTNIPISDSLTIAYRDDALSDWQWQEVIPNIEDSVGYFIVDGSFNHREYILVKADPSVLPVELLYFEPICGSDSVAVLEWSTATESNNDYFTLYRSSNGEDWKEIGKVDGQGTSYQVTDYRFVDRDLSGNEQAYYYRLQQTDYDGKFEIFEMKAIFCRENKKQVEIYPNPVVDYFNLDFNNPYEQPMDFSIALYNAAGLNVFVKHANCWSGHNTLRVEIPDLPKGTYYLHLLAEDSYFYTQPFIITK